MGFITDTLNEELTSAAFSQQALIFDAIYADNAIVNYKRARVRNHILKYLKPSSAILELNSGTGDDALHFAAKGHKVHATDIAQGMQNQLKKKLAIFSAGQNISTELCSFTTPKELKQRGPYDAIFSNFGGLNCTQDLDKVLASFNSLLKPGGTVTMVIISKFCLWELLLIFKGKFKTATRRWFSGKGRAANIDGNHFTCWYYNYKYVVSKMAADYSLISIEGLCTIVPPSYIEGFAEKHPKIYKHLTKLENRFKETYPFKYWGDYFIISLRKNA